MPGPILTHEIEDLRTYRSQSLSIALDMAQEAREAAALAHRAQPGANLLDAYRIASRIAQRSTSLEQTREIHAFYASRWTV